MKLTAKQEKFCQAVINGKTNYEAFCEAYDTKNYKTKGSIATKAWQVRNTSSVSARIDELRNSGAIDAIAVKDKITMELFEALEKAAGKAYYDEYEKIEEYDYNGNPTEDWKEKNITKQKVNLSELSKIADTLAKLYGLYEKTEDTHSGVVININADLED